MKFTGDVVAKWLRHDGKDRDMKLVKPFSFKDSKSINWTAPVGSIVNGASIPKFLWEEVGSPFVGDYRRASVLHDVACHKMLKTPKEVHRMFYDAMICDGVNTFRAKYMYAAVRLFSRKWKNGKIIKETHEEITMFEETLLSSAMNMDITDLDTEIDMLFA